MKIAVISAYLIALNLYGFSQAIPPRVQIVPGNSTIRPYYTTVVGTTRADTINITFQLSGAFDAATATNNDVSITLVPGNMTAIPVFNNGTATTRISFPASQWPGAGNTHEISRSIPVKVPSLSGRLRNPVAGQIELTGHPESFHTVRMSHTLAAPYNPSKSFWVEIGSNFDLVDGLEPNNLFAGVFFYKRDVRPISRPRESNLGIFAGIYESKTVTNTDEQNFSLRNYYDTTSFLPNSPDTIRIYQGVGTFTLHRVVKNVGLFFSPQLRLSSGTANADGLHFSLAAWFDLQWQKVIEDKTFTQIRQQGSFLVPIDSMTSYNAANYKKEHDIKSHYLGIGFPIFFQETIKSEVVQLFVNPVVGGTNQITQKYLQELEQWNSKGGTMPKRDWQWFYIAQFRLNEEKYGIAFTGEVRGLIKQDNPPFVSLALSKKFDLVKLVEFMGN